MGGFPHTPLPDGGGSRAGANQKRDAKFLPAFADIANGKVPQFYHIYVAPFDGNSFLDHSYRLLVTSPR